MQSADAVLPNVGCSLTVTGPGWLQVRPAFTAATIGCVYCGPGSGEATSTSRAGVSRHHRGVRSRAALTDGNPVTPGDPARLPWVTERAARGQEVRVVCGGP